MQTKIKIAIFGGTFDPFTYAHRNIVEKACKQIVDKVLIVPTTVNWYRKDKTSWLTAEQKTNIICATMHGSSCNCAIDDSEIKFAECVDRTKLDIGEAEYFLAKKGFYDTLFKIKAEYGSNYEFYFIIGTDQYKNFKNWRNWQLILKHAKMIVVQGRDGEVFEGNIPHETITIDPEFANVSASEVREEWMPKGYEAFNGWLNYENTSYWNEENKIAHTPIFDVVYGKAVNKMTAKEADYDWTLATKKVFQPILIKAPEWASIIVEKDGKWLMVKQLRYGTNAMSTEFPCGMVEANEVERFAAARELREETGYDVDADNLKYIGMLSPNPAFMTNHMHYFYVNLDATPYSQIAQKLDEHEKITYEWIDKHVAKQQILKSINSSAIMVAALALLDYKLLA